MAEKNILASFHSPEQAEGAARKLRALRAADVKVERISAAPGAGMYHSGIPVTGDFASLANLALGAEAAGRDEGVLLSAHPDASGMSGGGGGDMTAGRDVLLAAVVNEEVHRQALRVIEEAGGLI